MKRQGLGLVAISYDAPEVLKAFAASRGITFPLISDGGSTIIRRFGLLNTTVEPGTPTHGIPFPGTFVVDARGVVQSRHFEAAYQERITVGSILVGRGGTGWGPTAHVETPHLVATAGVSDEAVAPGERVSLVVEVTPRPGMHVYAPGGHDYRVIQLRLAEVPWLRVHPMQYPSSEIYYFEPLDERVEVYQRPFRLVQDVTILATPEAQAQLATRKTLTLSGRLEYQACDDRLCYSPQSLPVTFTLDVKPLDRRPPG